MTKNTRKKVAWDFEPATLEIVKLAKKELGVRSQVAVIEAWASKWNEHYTTWKNREETKDRVSTISDAKTVFSALAQDKPMASRVETPYQIEKKRKLEELRAKLENPALAVSGALEASVEVGGGETITFPFAVLVRGEKHQVREFHGRKVLERVGSKVNVMLKNLTPQETVIYWNQRTK